MTTKQEIFERLISAEGRWVSGEELGSMLAISRAAIWKAIDSLRKDGYSIEACSNRGYLFSPDPDLIIPSLISKQIKSQLIGKDELISLDEVNSTNTYAKELADKGSPEGTVVVSSRQSNGKGRLGRRWYSVANDTLCCSFILKPDCAPTDISALTLLATLAVYEVTSSYCGSRTVLKWPNDVLIGKKKVAGVLIEMDASPDEVHYAVVGIGININNSSGSFPSELKDIATSLFAETGKRVGRRELLCELIETLDEKYALFLSEGFAPIIEQCRAQCEIIGKTISIARRNDKISGTVMDIDIDGALLIRNSGGDIIRVFSGDTSK